MKNNQKRIFEILALILIAIFCISISPKTLQNDTFYTIKIGEYIVKNKGIDMVEPFAWYQGLEYTYPHWLYDVMIYVIYSLGGMTGIYISTCIFAVILGITLYEVNSKLAKNKVVSFVITIGAIYMLRDYITARAQLVTFILFILQIFCMEQLINTNKKRYGVALVAISILMANLHVAVWPFSFVLYLPYIVEYIVACMEERTAKKYGKEVIPGQKLQIIKKDGVKILIIFMLICILTGFLTPLGTTPYTYLIKTMQGETTHNISEHQPMTLIQSTDVLCSIIILLAILIFTNSKIKLKDLLMIGGLLLLMLYSRRQSSLYVLIGSIILNRIIYDWMESWVKDIDNNLINVITTRFGMFIVSAFILILSLYFIKPRLKSEYIDKNTYPVEMSEFIKNYFKEKNIDLSEVRLYNEYNYGSYLIYSGIPVFIDSRADLYSPEFNEGQDIFMDFIKSSNLEVYFEDIFEKYDITHVILYKDSKMNRIIEKANLENYKLLKKDEKFVFYEVKK